MQQIEELVLFIIKDLVENKDKIEVSTLECNDEYTIDIRVSKEDIGKVIGKRGRIINAIRGIVSLYSIKNKKKIFVEIKELD